MKTVVVGISNSALIALIALGAEHHESQTGAAIVPDGVVLLPGWKFQMDGTEIPLGCKVQELRQSVADPELRYMFLTPMDHRGVEFYPWRGVDMANKVLCEDFDN